ncbi:MAG: hypothetical protein IT497_10960 [Ottowia sp.]|nr:hypothetical protein [Ottowia sp.]
MSQDKTQEKTQRKAKTLEDEIAIARDKLKRLEEKQREQQKKWRGKNQKAVLELIRSEKFDSIDIKQWKSKIADLKLLLLSKTHQQEYKN